MLNKLVKSWYTVFLLENFWNCIINSNLLCLIFSEALEAYERNTGLKLQNQVTDKNDSHPEFWLLRNCKRNLKWPFMLWWQCSIFNGTLESYIWPKYEEDINVFVAFNCLFSFVVLRKWLAHFLIWRRN